MKSSDRVILHLRMTGGLLFTPENYPEEKYTHLIFHFDQGQKLLFSDMRRFGRFWFLKKEEEDTFSGIAKLGIEPFDPKLSADYLNTYLGTRKKAILRIYGHGGEPCPVCGSTLCRTTIGGRSSVYCERCQQ